MYRHDSGLHLHAMVGVYVRRRPSPSYHWGVGFLSSYVEKKEREKDKNVSAIGPARKRMSQKVKHENGKNRKIRELAPSKQSLT